MKKRGPKSGWKKKQINYDLLFRLCFEGLTNKQLAVVFGVNPDTIYEWKKDQKFSDILKKGKENADQLVEHSLWQRAIGYTHPEEVIFQHKGKIIRTMTLKHYPPDQASMIFWLKNRKPAEWKDRVEFISKETIDEDLEFVGVSTGGNGKFKRFYN